MAKVTISTKLWDLKAREWKRVHNVTFKMSEADATTIRDIFMRSRSGMRTEDPAIYKKHLRFTTDMFIEDDNGESMGGVMDY